MTAISIIETINSYMWTFVLPLLLLSMGLYLTLRLKGLPIFKSLKGITILRHQKANRAPGSISSYATLMLAMSATVGTGNIAGVLTALRLGGPGALFWMWLVGLIGLSLKYAETTLAVKYRHQREDGIYVGGPMYYLEKGAKMRWLAILLAGIFVVSILTGVGTFPQVHSIVDIFVEEFSTPLFPTALVLTILVAYVIFGGLKSTSTMALVIMPCILIPLFIISGYILILHAPEIPRALQLVFRSAFGLEAVTAGGTGFAVKLSIEHGIRRGIFSNESGMGSATMAAASAKVNYPSEQGIVHLLEVIVDTFIINTMTGLIFIVTGAYEMIGREHASLQHAFDDPLGIGNLILTVIFIFLAYTTIIAWSYYGSKCAYYLFGNTGTLVFRIAFIIIIFTAGFIDWPTVWTLSDFSTALMVIPNVLALFLLRHDIIAETERYLADKRQLE